MKKRQGSIIKVGSCVQLANSNSPSHCLFRFESRPVTRETRLPQIRFETRTEFSVTKQVDDGEETEA